MKVKKARDSGEWKEEPEEVTAVMPKTKCGKSWYQLIDYDTIIPLLPQLKNTRGGKSKLTIDIFSATNLVLQAIFEKNHNRFMVRGQVNTLAMYIGAKFLEQAYLIKKGVPMDPLSKLLEEQEPDHELWDRMKTIRESCQACIDKYAEGIITRETMDHRIKRFRDTLLGQRGQIGTVPGDKNDENVPRDSHAVMGQIIDDLLESLDSGRVYERVRKQKYREKMREKEKESKG